MSSMRCGCNVRMQRAVGVLRIEEDDEWHLDREAPVCDLGEDEEAALCRSFDAANEEERLSAALESGRARGNSRLWPPT
ncbi:hypothetical protein AB1Y20_003652 [Prymnesium parvum]|uniref:Uncharacterized protein n=1 Tax=Prymnesium parvum TaxID=97485 RepID=A0AB34J5F0_PRYPA